MGHIERVVGGDPALTDAKPLQLVGASWGSAPVDFAAMRDAQDQNAQGFILESHHDAPVANPIAPQRRGSGTARSAPERRSETARIDHHSDAITEKTCDAARDGLIEVAQIFQRACVKLNSPGQARAPLPRACRSVTGQLGCR